MTQQALPASKRRKSDAMSCGAKGGKETPCSCPRCDAHRQSLERKQQLRTLYDLPIYRLPPELILKIVDQLDLIEFPAMIIAMFHLLRHHGIAPSMPTVDLKVFLKCSNFRPRAYDTVTDTNSQGFRRLPIEVRLQIYRHLCPRDKINFVLATFTIPIDDIESLTHWQSPRVLKLHENSRQEGNAS